ncbi:CoA ester lyase [Agrobacterium sp. MOPV5]|uniref:HpcH/HpaI aldolase/citrate lyase family protein n=1 Tax=Agrobacterium leguminum TaxID=2792015 RepID=UPI0018C21249|nr:CoA ester lyase [Agrobacterium leguminum]MBG0511018.1 CoA ester lyase [Agrobacterium leguminum]
MPADLSFIAPLFVPATRPERFLKAAQSGADAIIIDLEDAVADEDKERARDNLDNIPELDVPYIVRVNGVGTKWFESDVKAVKECGAAAVLLPKAELSSMTNQIADWLSPLPILGLIETPLGVTQAGEIAGQGLVARFVFGPADFYAEMDVEPNAAMTAHIMRGLTLASKAAGIGRPIAGPCFDFSSKQTLVEECCQDRSSGAAGKLCIHPTQPRIVIAEFCPSQKEVEWAEQVLAASSSGAVAVGGQMLDGPIFARAQSIIAKSRKAKAPGSNAN